MSMFDLDILLLLAPQPHGKVVPVAQFHGVSYFKYMGIILHLVPGLHEIVVVTGTHDPYPTLLTDVGQGS